MCLLGHESTFRAVSNPAEGRSKPVPKTRNYHFQHQWLTCVNGPVHNLRMQFFTSDNSKIQVLETEFFHIVIT